MESNIAKLIREYLSHRFSLKTEEKIQRWIIEDQHTEDKEKASEMCWDAIPSVIDQRTYAALKRINARLGMIPAKKQLSLHTYFLRVAAILIPALFMIGGYFYYDRTYNWTEFTVAYADEKYLILPDSSEVWLNGGTTIRYPSDFQKNKRTVYLSGEAYFSVKKDNSRPFVVKTDQAQVKVLGTQFNVKAYLHDEKMITTLTSGKVEVDLKNKESIILKPSQQLIYYTKTSQLQLTKIPLPETKAWTEGYLIFTNATWNEIQHTLERKFNVSFKTDRSLLDRKEQYTVKFLKQETLSDILPVLKEVVGDISYQAQGKTILIQKR